MLTSVLPATAALAAVLAFILLSGFVFRMTRFGRRTGTTASRLSLLDSLSLDPRRRLVLIRCDDRCVLMLTGQRDQVVGWLPKAAP